MGDGWSLRGVEREVARKCSSYIDLTAGCEEEREFLNWLLGVIDSPFLTYEFEPITVLNWRERHCEITACGRSFRVVALPPVKGGWGSGVLTDRLEGDLSGKVLIVDFPEDLDDAKFIYIKAVERGVEAVIFRDRHECLRRIVISKVPYYRWDYTGDLEVPAFAVPKSVGDWLIGHIGEKVEFNCEADIRVSTGYNLIVNYEGGGEDYVYVVAHHDHWLTGFSDNCAGVGVLAELIRRIVKDASLYKRDVRFVIFTAEEFGSPMLSSLYWAYGSRIHVLRLKGRGAINRVYAVLNIDVVGRGFKAYAPSDVVLQLGGAFSEYKWEPPKPYYDAFNFDLEGIPTVVISSLDEYWDVYHSNEDVEERARHEDIQALAEFSWRLLEYLLKSELDHRVYLDLVKNDLMVLGLRPPSPDREDVRRLKSALGGYLVEYMRDGSVNLVYTDSIISYLNRLKMLDYKDVPLRVELLGHGDVILDTSWCKGRYDIRISIERALEGLSEYIRARLI